MITDASAFKGIANLAPLDKAIHLRASIETAVNLWDTFCEIFGAGNLKELEDAVAAHGKTTDFSAELNAFMELVRAIVKETNNIRVEYFTKAHEQLVETLTPIALKIEQKVKNPAHRLVPTIAAGVQAAVAAGVSLRSNLKKCYSKAEGKMLPAGIEDLIQIIDLVTMALTQKTAEQLELAKVVIISIQDQLTGVDGQIRKKVNAAGGLTSEVATCLNTHITAASTGLNSALHQLG